MNPESLENYKLQVYNPGSPSPTPKSDPLKAFPKVKTLDPENPLKITITKQRKRSVVARELELPESPSKKIKMMTAEDIKALHRELREESKKDMNEFKDDFNNKLALELAKVNTQINTQFSNVQKQLGTIAQTQDGTSKALADYKKESDDKIKALEEKFETLEQKTKEGSSNQLDENAIQDVVKQFVENSSSTPDSSWKANLAKEVFEHEHGIIIHGVRIENGNDDTKKVFIKNFFRSELKASEDMIKKLRIRDVCRLGSDSGSGKPPPILVKLGHPTERNQLLPLSSNLKQGITIDKNIPKLYQKTHKEFKRRCWKLQLLHDVKAQVVFEGYKMILRYKKKDQGVTKFNWVVEKEFVPEPSDLEAVLVSSSTRDPNKHDTPVIDNSVVASCNTTIIVTGVSSDVTESNCKREFLKLFAGNEEHTFLKDIKYKSRGTVLVICKDWAGCKYFCDKYHKSELLGKQIFLTLYSESDPSM